MDGPSHNFAYTDSERPVTQLVREALAPQYSAVPATRGRTLRRTWLDTFDWRLHRAGLTLEYVTGRGHGRARALRHDRRADHRGRLTARAGPRWPTGCHRARSGTGSPA